MIDKIGIDSHAIFSESPRFRRRRRLSRGETRSRPKLPDVFQVDSVYKSAGDSPAKKSISDRVKKLVQGEEELLDDDERHRRLVERLTSRIRKSHTVLKDQSRETLPAVVYEKDDVTQVQSKDIVASKMPSVKSPLQDKEVETKVSPVKPKKKLATKEEEPRMALELDEPPIPTMRRRRPDERSDLVAMFAARSSSESKPENLSSNPSAEMFSAIVPDGLSDSSEKSKLLHLESVVENMQNNDSDKAASSGMFIKIIAACIVLCLMFVVMYSFFL